MKVLWITPVYPNEYQPYSGVFCQIQAHHIADLGLVPEIVVPVPYVSPLVKWMNQRYGFFNSMAGHAEDGPIHISRVRYITSPREYVFGVSHVTQRLAISALNLKKPNLIQAHSFSSRIRVLVGQRKGRLVGVLPYFSTKIRMFGIPLNVLDLSGNRFVTYHQEIVADDLPPGTPIITIT